MNIGYPCLNYSLKPLKNMTFRLANYSEERLFAAVSNNLAYLKCMLEYNVVHHLLFFRISSDLVPFASHPICRVNWQSQFQDSLKSLGRYLNKHHFRISMHPSQFVVINTSAEKTLANSLAELKWHCELLDLMGLDLTAKVQIHVGGAYGDKKTALERFITNYKLLPQFIQERLVIENDDRIFSLRDCLDISEKIQIPIIFDNFHHECLNEGESLVNAVKLVAQTWTKKDGVPMHDYSSQEPGMRKGKHAETLAVEHFRAYLEPTIHCERDIMLEIKDKELSAIKALNILNDLSKLHPLTL